MSTEDIGIATSIGYQRWSESVRKGRKDRLGTKSWFDGLAIHVYGVVGELAAARALGIYPTIKMNQFSGGAPDLDPDWEVRYRTKLDYDLIVRDRDDDDRRFILVRGQPPSVDVVGWIYGREAKKAEWVKNYRGLGSAFFVPADALNKI